MEILAESAVRVTVLAAGVAVLLKVLRIRSPRTAHHVWAGVALVMLVLPAIVAWGPKAMIPLLPESRPFITGTPPPSDPVVESDVAQAPPTAIAERSPRLPNRELVAVVLYASGVVLLLLRLGVGFRHARTLARDATLVDGRLAHPRCITPVTVGLLAPVVILPPDWATWTEPELTAVLAHEEEHVRRRDPLIAFITLLNRALFWFHPLAWWLQREVSTLAEQACDAVVISQGHDADVYSGSLLRFAKSMAGAGGRVSPLGTAMPGAGLRYRLGMLANPPAPPASAARLACTAVAYGAAVAMCSAATPTTSPAWSAATGLPPSQSAPGQVANPWSVHATEHFDIFYERQQEDLLGEVSREAERAFAHVSSQLKYDVAQRVPLILVGRDDDLLANAAGPIDLISRTGAPSRQRIVISTESLEKRPGIMVHELTHHFAFEIIPDASRVAPWLIEGLAEHERGVWDAGDFQRTRDAAASGQIPVLESLAGSDRHWAHALFDFVAAEYGAEGIRRYLFVLRTRSGPTDAIPVAFGVSLGDFNRAFRAYVATRFGGR
jgi:hypothetical protein